MFTLTETYMFFLGLFFQNRILKNARIFTDFWLKLLEGKVLHNGTWVATLLGVQVYKTVNFPGRDISSLAVKGLKDIWKLTKIDQNISI